MSNKASLRELIHTFLLAASKTSDLSLKVFNSAKSRSSHPKTCKTHKSPKEVVQRCYGETHKTNRKKHLTESLFFKYCAQITSVIY